MFQSKKIQAEKFYGNGSDMEKFAKETDIKISDGKGLIAKANALESYEKFIIAVYFSHESSTANSFCGKVPTSKIQQ